MEVKFIHTNQDNLNSVPIVDGQIIVLKDASGVYYDMDSTRHSCASNASSSNYGLVKLSDAYISSEGTADSSVGASSKAVCVIHIRHYTTT